MNEYKHELILLGGFPRSGSTLIANILAQHPQIYATASSPLQELICNLRKTWSNDLFVISQLDHDYDNLMIRFKNIIKGVCEGWMYSEKFNNFTFNDQNNTFLTIDKNRAWMKHFEFIREVYPNIKMLITIREPIGIVQSIEKAHNKTRLLEYPDQTSADLVTNRISQMLDNKGVIGEPIQWLQNLDFVPNIHNNVYIVRYEDIINDPVVVVNSIIQWLGMPEFVFNPGNIQQVTYENDGIFRFKYPHKIDLQIHQTEKYPLAPLLERQIFQNFQPFYQRFYPEIQERNPAPPPSFQKQESELVQELNNLIDEESSN